MVDEYVPYCVINGVKLVSQNQTFVDQVIYNIRDIEDAIEYNGCFDFYGIIITVLPDAIGVDKVS